MLVPLLLPKQPWPVEAWTPLDPWRCAVVSGTKMLAADTLSPVSCEEEPPWIRLVFSSHPSDAWLDWDLGNSDAKLTPQTHCWAPQTIPEPFLLCGRAHYPAEKGHSHWAIPFPRKGVHGLKQYLLGVIGVMSQSNIHMDKKTQGFPAEYCPKHASLPSSHSAS